MMKTIVRGLLSIPLCFFADQAYGEMCTVDNVPAATLLVPYFEVDLTTPAPTLNTIVSINNSASEPVLGHVTFWGDWAMPVLNFDIFLTGFDVVTLDLFDVLVNGNLPITAHQNTDPDDLISPEGSPGWDGDFTNCDLTLPFGTNPILTGNLLDRVQNGHSGYAGSVGQCFGEPLNGAGNCSGGVCTPGTIARGYITIDVVTACNLLFPNQPGYFEITDTRNVIWGDVFYTDGSTGTSFMPLVHVEADENFDATSTPTGYTFYGRYTQGLVGADHREPLGTVWNARYFAGFGSTTDWVVWRDPTANDTTDGYPCAAGPAWNPLEESEILCFDQMESSAELCAGPEAPACLPLASQRLDVDQGDLTVPFDFGWCRLSLNIPGDTIPNDVDFPPFPAGDTAQSFVATIHRSGMATGGLAGFMTSSACQEPEDPQFAPPVEVP